MTLLDENATPRIVGHGRTFWIWNGKVIAWAQRVSHTPASPISQAVDVTPLNYVRPVVIAPPRAISRGEITMEIIEPYQGRAWDVLANSGGTDSIFGSGNGAPQDLADVFHAFQSSGTTPTLIRLIRPPARGSDKTPVRVEEYSGIQILDVQDGEEASAETMTNTVTITVGYTGRVRSKAEVGDLRNDPGGTKINSKVY